MEGAAQVEPGVEVLRAQPDRCPVLRDRPAQLALGEEGRGQVVAQGRVVGVHLQRGLELHDGRASSPAPGEQLPQMHARDALPGVHPKGLSEDLLRRPGGPERHQADPLLPERVRARGVQGQGPLRRPGGRLERAPPGRPRRGVGGLPGGHGEVHPGARVPRRALHVPPGHGLHQPAALVGPRGHEGQGKGGHLVLGAQPVPHPPRRRARVVGVVRRVVVAVLELQASPCGQRPGFREPVVVLPVEVPVLDAEQDLRGPARGRGAHLHDRGQVVGVRVERAELRGHGQGDRVGGPEVRDPGADVDLLRAHHERHGELGGRLLREVQPDPGLHALRPPRGRQVELQHQVAARPEPPGPAGGLPMGALPRGPAQEVTVGRRGEAHGHPLEPGARVRGSPHPRVPRPVHLQHRVVDARAAGSDLHRLHEAQGFPLDREDQVHEQVRTVGGDLYLLQSRDDQVGPPQLPPLGEDRRLGRAGVVPAGGARLRPALEDLHLPGREAPRAHEVPVGRQPRRHVSAGGHPRHLPPLAEHVLVGEEAEGRRLPRSMALRAVPVHDPGDVVGPGDVPADGAPALGAPLGRGPRRLLPRAGDQAQGHSAQDQPPHLASSSIRQPTAGRASGTTPPAPATASSASRSSVLPASARLDPSAGYRSSMRPR